MTVNEHNRATTIRSRRSALFSSAIVLVVGALLSAGLAHVHQRMLDRARTQYVEQSGTRIVVGLQQQFALAGELAREFQALFMASDNVSEAAFAQANQAIHTQRSEVRRVGKGWVGSCRVRW